MTLKTLSSLIAAGALLVLSGCYFPSAVAVSPSVGVSVSAFDPYLDPYGSWVTLPGYGRTWQPSPAYVGADFYPYGTGGQWLYTDAGWVFESDYPFGWAVFHYGRWLNDPQYGWLWVPGSEWAPSWVSWRVGGPYVGWAPLGPYGPLAFNYASWCFVPTASFTVRNVRAYSTGYYDFHHAVGVTAPVRARVGPSPRYISYATGRNITPLPVGAIGSSGRVPPPPPPPASASSGPVQVRPPPPPVGWRSQPGGSGGFVPPPPPSSNRTPPSTTFTNPRSYQPSAPAPAPMQAPSRAEPAAPRSPPPPPSAAPAPMQRPAPPPSMSMPAPPPPSSYRSAPAPAPAPHISAPPPPSAPRAAPPPPPHR